MILRLESKTSATKMQSTGSIYTVCSVKKVKGKTRDSCPLLHRQHHYKRKKRGPFALAVLAFLPTIFLVPHLPRSLLLCIWFTLLLQILLHLNKEQIKFYKSQHYWFPQQFQKAPREIQVFYWRNKPHPPTTMYSKSKSSTSSSRATIC